MAGSAALPVVLLLLLACASTWCGADASAYDDFHYPSEEPRERATAELSIPTVSLRDPKTGPLSMALFKCPGTAEPVQVAQGANITCGEKATWQVHAIWGAEAATGTTGIATVMVAAEQQFTRWSLLAFLSPDTPSVLLRKAIGSLTGIEQPWFNLTAPYLAAAAASLADLPSQLASNTTADHEPDYPSMASTLAPQRDTAAISHAADVVKFAVAYSGRVKCASTGVLKEGSNTGGIAELRDLRAPFPDIQKIIFDPSDYLSYWPSTYGNSKIGLVGGHLGVANVGAFTHSVGGMETMAFGPVPPHEPGGVPPPFPYVPPPPSPAPAWECARPGPAGDGSTQPSCLQNNKTWTGGANAKYPGCGTCYCCQRWAPSPPAPRLPNINYNPGVFVMLRDETASGGTVNGTRYFYATNSTTKELPTKGDNNGAVSFYQALLAVYQKDQALLSGMQVGANRHYPCMSVFSLVSSPSIV